MTERRERFLKKIKEVLKEGRLFRVDDAMGLSIMLRTDEEMDLMEKFLEKNPQSTHDEILEYALEIKEIVNGRD